MLDSAADHQRIRGYLVVVSDRHVALFVNAQGMPSDDITPLVKAGLDAVFDDLRSRIRAAAYLTEEERSDFRRTEAGTAPFSDQRFAGRRKGGDRIDVIAAFMIEKVLKELASE